MGVAYPPIQFRYKGLRFRDVSVFPDSCVECAKKYIARLYEEYCKDIVTPGPDGPMVQWDAFLKATERKNAELPGQKDLAALVLECATREERSPAIKDLEERTRVIEIILHHLGILCSENGRKSYWEILAPGLEPCNPYPFSYFVRKADAIAYVLALCARFFTPLCLRKISFVCTWGSNGDF